MSCLQFKIIEGNGLGAKIVYGEVNFATCNAIILNDLKTEHLIYPLFQTVIKSIISGKWMDCSQINALPGSGTISNCRELSV